MDSCGLAGIVAEVVLRGLDDAGDRGDIDDSAAVAVLIFGGLLEVWEECHGHEEELGDVGAVSVDPVIEG